MRGHTAQERQSRDVNPARPQSRKRALAASPGSGAGGGACYPEVSRKDLRGDCLPGKRAESPQGPPLKGCVCSPVQVLYALETRTRVCHSPPPLRTGSPAREAWEAGGRRSRTADTILPVIGFCSSFTRVEGKSQMLLRGDTSQAAETHPPHLVAFGPTPPLSLAPQLL